MYKYYKSPDNKPFAYLADGSQDEYIPEGFIEITEEEQIALSAIETERIISENIVVQPAPTKEELMAKLLEIQTQISSM